MADPNTTTARAKVVAQLLTDNGLEVTPPDEGTLDDIEMERWKMCIQIADALQ